MNDLEFKPIKQNPNDFVLFLEPYTVKRKVPCEVLMKNIDTKLPPHSVINNGSKAIRTYWNNKNKKRRVKN